MIRLVETATLDNGEVQTSEKTFSSMKALKKSLDNSGMAAIHCYNIMKRKETTVTYDDATVVIKLIEEKPTTKLVGLDGRPFDQKAG